MRPATSCGFAALAALATAAAVQAGGPSACPADTNGDTTVDVQDLLLVITTWGSCAGECPADVNDDGAVDVQDLTAVISSWGSCPPGTLALDQWTFIHADDSRSSQFFGLAMADLTGDGLGDIASGPYFYRNPGGDMTAAWPRTTFPEVVDALLAVDVDGDALGDLIAMDSDGLVHWLEALDAQGTAWSVLQVGDVGVADHDISSQGYALGQLVAGGKPEIVINVGSIYYFQIPPDPDAGSWPMTLLEETADPEGIALADIDGDGDVDLCALPDQTTIAWWENPGNGAPSWSSHVLGEVPSISADRFAIVQLDEVNGPDVVVSVANGAEEGVYWFAAPADPTSPDWVRKTVATIDSANSMDVADVDNDGDIDIVTGEHFGAQRVLIYENVDAASSWTEHVVDTGHESHLGTRLADLDGDGDLDIASIAWNDFEDLYIWRNGAIGP